MQRLENNSIGRLLHHLLYQRMVAFANEYTPEFPAESVVQFWLNEFYNGNGNYHILVDIDSNYNIKAHCVLIDNETFGLKTVICYQIKDDNKTKTFIDDCFTYADKLPVHAIMFSVQKNSKVYQEKYGYIPIRTVMYKSNIEE